MKFTSDTMKYILFLVKYCVMLQGIFLDSLFLKYLSRPHSRIHDLHIGKVPLQGSIPMRTQTYIQTYPNSIRVQRSINNKLNLII